MTVRISSSPSCIPTTIRRTVRLRLAHIQERQAAGEVVTGLLYVDPEPEDLHTHLKTVTTPLNRLGEKDLCPGSAALAEVNAGYR